MSELDADDSLIVCRLFEGPPHGYITIIEYERAVARIRELEGICLQLESKYETTRRDSVGLPDDAGACP